MAYFRLTYRGMAMSNIVFLFGAGASYGADGIAPHAPPLGPGLFTFLAKRFPETWGRLPAAVRAAFGDGRNFEAGMGAIMDALPGYAVPLQRQMAEALLKFRIHDPRVCAYSQLVSVMKAHYVRHSITLASLNYDVLLEEAMVLHGLPIHYHTAAPPLGQYCTIKPHGSANFLPSDLLVHPMLALNAPLLRVNASIKPASRDDALGYLNNSEQGLPPAMSFFMSGKPTFCGEEQIQHMQTGFSLAVAAADTVITVGVRPFPQDHHIWDCLSATVAEVVMCCAEAEYQEWRAQTRSEKPTRFIGDRFGSAIPAIVKVLEAP